VDITVQQLAIQIGPVGLRDFEVPTAISFGGEQRVHVHRLYGGSRVVEPLGAEPATIRFEGVFTGSDAAIRFREVDRLRISGDPVWLSWGSFRHVVIVQTLRTLYRSPWWIQFQISCVAATSIVASQSTPIGLNALVASDLRNAAAAATLPGISIYGLQAALATRQALTLGASAQVAASAAAALTLTNIDQGIVNASTLITSPSGLNDPAMATSSAFLARVDACGRLAGSVVARAYVARIGATLTGGMS
jgi:hypothetical protein